MTEPDNSTNGNATHSSGPPDVTSMALASPQVLRMRRLVMAEADRFAETGREYFERSWVRTTGLLAETLVRLTERGLLTVDDPGAG